jgi:hypothetical protein
MTMEADCNCRWEVLLLILTMQSVAVPMQLSTASSLGWMRLALVPMMWPMPSVPQWVSDLLCISMAALQQK